MDRPIEGWDRAVEPSQALLRGIWAETPLTRAQWVGLGGIAAATGAGFAFAPLLAAEVVIGALIVLAAGHMVFRCLIWTVGQWPGSSAAPARADDTLPVYSIIVPLYREANMAVGLVAALERLDYPKDRLDILVALETDDAETQTAFGTLELGPHWRIVIAPPGAPRTKPRACNIALSEARGAFLVIYDAEDRPEPDQLRRALSAFDAGGENLACLQARLFPFNARERIVTRLFALDFAQWFDAMLTGLQRLGFPVPLGGTSNHFRGIM